MIPELRSRPHDELAVETRVNTGRDGPFYSQKRPFPIAISLVTHLKLLEFCAHSLLIRTVKLTVIESNNESEVVDKGSKVLIH